MRVPHAAPPAPLVRQWTFRWVLWKITLLFILSIRNNQKKNSLSRSLLKSVNAPLVFVYCCAYHKRNLRQKVNFLERLDTALLKVIVWPSIWPRPSGWPRGRWRYDSTVLRGRSRSHRGHQETHVQERQGEYSSVWLTFYLTLTLTLTF